jgi:3-dehydrosphinganine reductase
MDDVSNKLVLITGGNSGIGLELAKLLAARGASVCILARRTNVLQSAREEILACRTSPDQKVTTITAAVHKAGGLRRAIEKWMQAEGVPDLVINSAGVVMPGEFMDLDLETFHWMMDINYFGTVNMIKVVLPRMLERGSGYIVNIASIAAFVNIYGYTAYGASKFALRGFTDGLRSEMKLHDIHISLVVPSDTNTPQLEFESQHRPEITRIIAKFNTVMEPGAAARAILKGIEHKRYLIFPAFDTKITFMLINLLGSRVYTVVDWLTAWAARKASRDQRGLQDA